MARKQFHKLQPRTLISLVVIGVIIGGLLTASLLQAATNQLQDRSLKMSNSRVGETSTYQFAFRPLTLDTIQTVLIQICYNDVYLDIPCIAPSGFDASNAELVEQTGDMGFNVSPNSTSNELILQRAPFSSLGTLNSYTFDNIVNPDYRGSFYVRIQTFADTDMNAEPVSYGAIAFVTNESIDVTATVPPYLLFCVGVTVNGNDCESVQGNYVEFGEFSSRQASQGRTQMLAASNAKDGYGIWMSGTTLTSGNNVIPALIGADVSRPGVAQFGMNLRANSSPQGGLDVSGSGNGQPTNGYSQSNFYRFNDGDLVAASNGPDEARKYTATYIANVTRDQAPGVYVSTVTYTALGSY